MELSVGGGEFIWLIMMTALIKTTPQSSKFIEYFFMIYLLALAGRPSPWRRLNAHRHRLLL